jgi:hypothetical protein
MHEFKGHEFEWYYDPSTPTQAVGEGTTLQMPHMLFKYLGLTYHELIKDLDGNFKTGIHKEGWGSGEPFFHDFVLPYMAIHMNAIKLQDYVTDKVRSRVKMVERNVKHEDIDADFILDCSGKPSTLDDFYQAEYIPVNAVYVTQCFWDGPTFFHTEAIAKKHGWVFCIPLQNRCSVGYMYNKDINTLEDVKEDVQEIFHRLKLTPSDTTNSFSFRNYYRKNNYQGRVCYNGNSSFFLEPLEATSFDLMSHILSLCTFRWNKAISEGVANAMYVDVTRELENQIMLHYMAGSKYSSPFWDFAKERGTRCIKNACQDPRFVNLIKEVKKIRSVAHGYSISGFDNPYATSSKGAQRHHYGSWPIASYWLNIKGLGIEEQINNMLP